MSKRLSKKKVLGVEFNKRVKKSRKKNDNVKEEPPSEEMFINIKSSPKDVHSNMEVAYEIDNVSKMMKIEPASSDDVNNIAKAMKNEPVSSDENDFPENLPPSEFFQLKEEPVCKEQYIEINVPPDEMHTDIEVVYEIDNIAGMMKDEPVLSDEIDSRNNSDAHSNDEFSCEENLEMAFYKKRLQTVDEVISVLEELEAEKAIDAAIIPPDVDELTDEEEIEDERMIINDEGDGLPIDVVGTFEIHATLDDKIDITVPETIQNTSEEPKQKKKRHMTKWLKRVPTYTDTPKNCEVKCVEEIQNKFGSLKPIQMFELFLDKAILDEIITFSIKYAQSKNHHFFSMSRTDLKKFIGILIFTGYHSLPEIKFYWSLDEDKGIPLIRKTMSRNRFDEIMKYIHLSDNDKLDKSDKFSKLRPFFDELNKRYMQFGVFSHKISIDEEMVPYFGRHSADMFIRGKPARFGYKLWCIASAGGYVYQFDPYGGASQKTNENLSLGERVVINLLKVVHDPENHIIFFDNFFTSHYLLTLLSEMKFFATGTVRETRLPSCPLQTTEALVKEPKGNFDYRFDGNNKIFAVRWHDNSVVTVVTNFGTLEPIMNIKRYNRKEKKYKMVPQPNVIHQYNQGMGGVDLHDNAIADYRIRIRGKKWWWPLFSNGIDSAIVNAWKMYQLATGSTISQIDFRSQIVLSLLKTEEESEPEVEHQSQKRNIDLERPNKNKLPGAAKDKTDHILIRNEENARRRCRICKSQTIYICKKCKVHLHTKCFSKFHE